MSNSNEYMNAYMKTRYQQRRELAHSILGRACANCGSLDNLEIDHIKWEDKAFKMNKLWNCAYATFLEELNKCQILCRSCHIEKSRQDIRAIKLQRGGGNQYGSY